MAKVLRIIFIIAFFYGLTGCKEKNPSEIFVDPWMPNGSERVVNNGFLTWNFQYGTDGFSNSTGEKCQTENGFLLWHQQSGGYLLSPEQLHIPAGKVQTVELRLASTGATLKLLWKLEGGGFTQSVSIPLIADGQYHDYQIELGQHIQWTGTISQLAFQTETSENIAIDFIRLTGIYFVPFPFISFNYESDLALMNELKGLLSETDQSVVLGFCSLVEFLSQTDANGDYLYYHHSSDNITGGFNPYYLLSLAKETNMPMVVWIRGDPGGFADAGMYKQLYADDHHLMWTAALNANPAYRTTSAMYTYLCLAQEELDGSTPAYWLQTDKLIGQCAELFAKMIQDNPDHILAVTTTTEIKFNTEDQKDDLDYNPKTIREFRNYCQQKYGTLAALNAALGTDFTTFELRSTDFDPTTVENMGGFDAPRTRGTPVAFWKDWKDFRAQQIHSAVQRQVEAIAKQIDSKYIYTHQIASDIEVCESPPYTGNVAGANVGIDMFTHEARETTIQEIASFVKDDPTRSWGVPEWLVLRDGDPAQTVEAMKRMRAHGIKYLCPFHWSGGGEFDIKDTPAFEAIRNYLRDY